MDMVNVTINGIETPIQKYINYVWEGLTFNDYLTLLNKKPVHNEVLRGINKEDVYEFAY